MTTYILHSYVSKDPKLRTIPADLRLASQVQRVSLEEHRKAGGVSEGLINYIGPRIHWDQHFTLDKQAVTSCTIVWHIPNLLQGSQKVRFIKSLTNLRAVTIQHSSAVPGQTLARLSSYRMWSQNMVKRAHSYCYTSGVWQWKRVKGNSRDSKMLFLQSENSLKFTPT